jgi:hypothetical protein
VVTKASLVQAEGKTHDDFRKMADVVYNRLEPGNQETNGKIEFDSTYNYIMKQSEIILNPDDLRNHDDPYNTYFYRGLPPGPIANPGEEAVEAAMTEGFYEAVVRALGRGLGMAVNRYTADVDVDHRDVLRERFADRERRADRPLGVVLVRDGRAEERHHGVADELLHGAAEALELVPDTLVVGREERPDVLGIGALGASGRPYEIAEEHGHDLALLAGGRGRGERRAAHAAEPEPCGILLPAVRAELAGVLGLGAAVGAEGHLAPLHVHV